MDCEKFEPLLLDELYEELDELTSAAVKRHVAGCARCASALSSMKATRRAVSLPLVPLPEGLEDRILAAAKEAQKVVPIKSRMSRALSIAGSWAMRPQTAMAAVFLLMIGSSAFLVRSKNYASSEATVSVTVQGAPAPTVAVAENDSLDDKAAASAHGPSTQPNVTRPPAAASALARDESAPADRLGGGAREKAKSDDADPSANALAEATGRAEGKGGYAPSAPAATATAAPMIANAAAPAGAPAGPNDGFAQTPAKSARTADGPGQDHYSLGAAAFQARNFAEATRQFDAAAQTGDLNAALWAAESTREGQGCAVALGRFEKLAQQAQGAWVGSEASLRAARCQIAMGQLDPARDRLTRLAQVGSHQQAAQQALAELNQVAQRKSGGGGSAAGAAAAPKRAAPAARSAPVRAPAEGQKAVDRATGF